MSKKSILVVAEKPSVAKALAAWLSKKLGVSEVPVGRSHIEVGEYNISWLFGHVLENFEPHDYDIALKKWAMASLPFIPATWQLKIREEVDKATRRKTGKPDPGTLAQVKALKSLLSKATEVIGLGDPDQEGQLLQDEFLLWAGNKAPVKRLWLAAVDDDSIEKAWKAMKPNADYAGWYWSALARSHADFLVGMNFSRAATLASQANGGNATLPVGRVQTPTVALVVIREKEIRAFKPVDYYTPFIDLASVPGFKASWNPDKEKDSRLDPEGRLLDRKVADGIVAACKADGKALVTLVKSTKGKEAPPLPFALQTLQPYMDKRFGMSPSDTLKHAQSLYEKKLATYPRSDSEHLVEAQFADAPALVASIGKMGLTQLAAGIPKANTTLRSAAWNDKKANPHHGIIPRPTTFAQFNALSRDEQLVWLEITKRYLLQFFPAAEFLKSEIELTSAKEAFRATGKVFTNRGWKDAFVSPGEEDEDDGTGGPALPALTKGQEVKLASAGVTATRTKAPKRFTQGTLLDAMNGIHRYVTDPALKATLRENAGIGTVATQSATIEELFRKSFFVLDKKEIKPTLLAEQLIDTLPRQLTAPDMTALWQQDMADIRSSGKAGYDAFMAKQAAWLRKSIDEVPDWFRGKALIDKSKPAAGAGGGLTTKPTKHKCLVCGGALAHIKGKFGWFFGCQEPSCKTSFKDVGGEPVAKAAPVTTTVTFDGVTSGDKCPKCGKGEMQVRTCGPTSKTPGKQFLSCSNFFAKGKDKCDHSVWPK
ncbi:DNA topoisomerase [Achromobacter xylosoxidans]